MQIGNIFHFNSDTHGQNLTLQRITEDWVVSPLCSVVWKDIVIRGTTLRFHYVVFDAFSLFSGGPNVVVFKSFFRFATLLTSSDNVSKKTNDLFVRVICLLVQEQPVSN